MEVSMTALSGKPSHHPIRHLNIPLRPLKAGTVENRPAKITDATLVDRIRSEFLEMRGFSPTLEQARRLFCLPEDECRRVLAALVTEGFLRVERDGRYRLSRHR
jgi:hypothetical protein